MSSKRRSYDTDEITLRKVFAKSVVDNTNIGAMKVLTADGAGGTYWTIPSTNGAWNPAFNRIVTNAATFTADLSYNTFTLSEGTGIGFSQGAGSNQLYIYGKSFTQVDVSGNNSFSAYENNSLDPVIRFAATGGINIRSNPTNNTLTFDGTGVQVSSSLYSFQKAFVINNTSTINDGISSLSGLYLNAGSPSAALTYVGIGDINLSTNLNTNSIYFYLNQSTGSISSLYGYLDTISSLYTRLSDFSTATQSLSTIAGSNFSTGTSTSYGINSNLSIVVFNLPFNQYTTLQQFNFATSNLTAGISTLSTNYTPLPALFSTSSGLNDRISTFNFISSISTLNVYGGDVTNFTANTVYFIQGDLSTFSTTTGVEFQTISTSIVTLTQQVSTLSTLTLFGLSSLSTAIGTLGNIYLPSTVQGLGTYGYVSTPSLYSSITGLGTLGYVSTSGLTSTVTGLGSIGYISTPSLVSTVEGLGTYGIVNKNNLTSSIIGLGTANYISSSQLTSSIAGLDKIAVTQLIAGNGIVLSPTNGKGDVTIRSGMSTSFTSSILYQGFNGPINGENYLNNTSSFFFSTADVYLDKFSSYITSSSRILLDFTYNFQFSYWSIYTGTNTNTNGNIVYFSTALVYNQHIDNKNVVSDSFTAGYPIDLGSPSEANKSNLARNSITRRQQFQLSTLGVMNNYLTPVQLYHSFDNCLFYNDLINFNYFSGFYDSTVNVLYSSTNSVFVTIQN